MTKNKNGGWTRVIVVPLMDFQHDEGAILAQRRTRSPFVIRILWMPHESDWIQVNRFPSSRFDTVS
ncbi:MAG: hypothetical protein KF722_18445 [Nitrospira sp.]|nr:hypothetical protein [Nitrospira sp.]